MNNSQFRRLVGDPANAPASSSSKHDSKSTMLGSRARPSVPMTPRSLGGQRAARDSASQSLQQRWESNGEPPAKKFKTNAAPKGTKLAAGYTDRALERRGVATAASDEDDKDDKATRVKALEEMLKLQQIDRQTFEKLRDELGVGGDTSSTHLVKGLDWKLLERARQGKDVSHAKAEEQTAHIQEEADVDEELEQVLDKEVTPQTRRPPSQPHTQQDADMPTTMVSRDEILRRFREKRLGGHDPGVSETTIAPSLGDRFKKFGETPQPRRKKFTETINGRRREVLVITDEDGRTKRKTRWIDPEMNTTVQQQPVLGGDVSAEIVAKQKAFEAEQKRKEQEEAEAENGDLFADAGEYNPLAGLDSDESEAESQGDEKQTTGKTAASAAATAETEPSHRARDYFTTGTTKSAAEDVSDYQMNPISQDPAILAALKRAAQLRQGQSSSSADPESTVQAGESVDPDQAAKHRDFLASLKERDRQDAQDIDMGFGGPQMDDEGDDDEGDGGDLAVWNAEDQDEGEGGRRKGGASGGRKRGKKKRKGDKDNVQDVMRVLEGRQKNER